MKKYITNFKKTLNRMLIHHKRPHMLLKAKCGDHIMLWFVMSWVQQAGNFDFRANMVCCSAVPAHHAAVVYETYGMYAVDNEVLLKFERLGQAEVFTDPTDDRTSAIYVEPFISCHEPVFDFCIEDEFIAKFMCDAGLGAAATDPRRTTLSSVAYSQCGWDHLKYDPLCEDTNSHEVSHVSQHESSPCDAFDWVFHHLATRRTSDVGRAIPTRRCPLALLKVGSRRCSRRSLMQTRGRSWRR
jgi:hypothetical protein